MLKSSEAKFTPTSYYIFEDYLVCKQPGGCTEFPMTTDEISGLWVAATTFRFTSTLRSQMKIEDMQFRSCMRCYSIVASD